MVYTPQSLVNEMNQGLFFVVANKLLFAKLLGRILPSDWKEELLASYIGLLFYHQVITPIHDDHHPVLRKIYKIATVIFFNWLLTGDLSITGIIASTVTLIIFALFDKPIMSLLGKLTGHQGTQQALRDSIDSVIVLSFEDTPFIDIVVSVTMAILYKGIVPASQG